MVIRATKSVDPNISAMSGIECGAEAAKHFNFEEGYRNLNHGSFGTYPFAVRDVQRFYQDACEQNPDKWVRYDFPKALDGARETIAKYLNAPMDDIVFVVNATTGVNTVLRNLVYKPGDVIVYFSTIYGACEMTVKYLAETTEVEAHAIKCTAPISDDDLTTAFETALKQLLAAGKTPKIAVFDTISSLPGVRVPFAPFTALCRAYNVLSCIDGAHSIGQIPLDLAALDPDFYVSNCHKWLYTPRGCAVFYVPRRNQTLMRSTLPTSHGFIPAGSEETVKTVFDPNDKTQFVNNFEFIGTLDTSPYICVPAALQWRSKLRYGDRQGEDAIYAYCHELARKGGKAAAKILGTEVMENAEGSLGECMLTNVRLPISYIADAGGNFKEAVKLAQWFARTLLFEYKTYVGVYIHGERYWARMSAQVYLTLDDFEWTAKAMNELSERARNGEWRT